jgi:hypothetical protein
MEIYLNKNTIPMRLKSRYDDTAIWMQSITMIATFRPQMLTRISEHACRKNKWIL